VRIAYVTETYPPEINGVSLTAERAVNHLRQGGHQVQLLRPRQRGEGPRDSADEWRTRGGPIPLYPELRYGLASVQTLRRRWRGEDAAPAPDLVHVATPGPLAWAALRAARAEGIPTSAEFRTNFHAYSRHYRLGWLEPLVLAWLRRLHAMADATFVPTPAMAAQLQEQGFRHLHVVGRGVDPDRYSPRWRDDWLRRDWHAHGGDPVLLHVGRLAPEKNVELALDTYERLRSSVPGLRMVVVGDGPLRGRLQARHPQVRFVGVKRGTDLARHYASADVFLFPSLTDTFGNVTLEALASGLAVVAYDTAAASLHVRDGVSGCLAAVPAGAYPREAFMQATRRALSEARTNSPLRRQARQAGRAADWDSVLRAFEQRLRATAGAAGAPVAHAALA
jgi:glycosyltransferase involved in cell wall biosynthesis